MASSCQRESHRLRSGSGVLLGPANSMELSSPVPAAPSSSTASPKLSFCSRHCTVGNKVLAMCMQTQFRMLQKSLAGAFFSNKAACTCVSSYACSMLIAHNVNAFSSHLTPFSLLWVHPQAHISHRGQHPGPGAFLPLFPPAPMVLAIELAASHSQ